MRSRVIFIVLVIATLAAAGFGQRPPKYNHAAQRALIPVELGKVYLGMPFGAFGAMFDLRNAEADGRFTDVAVTVPFVKGTIESFRIKFAGVNEEEKALFLRTDKVMRKGEFGDHEEEIQRIDPAKVPKKAFIYELVVTFKKGFDVRTYALKRYGPAKDVYKAGDRDHFYDLQWTRKTTDGLVWLIRYYEETRTIGLYGRIKGTEWSVD